MNYREAYAAYQAAKKAIPRLEARIQELESQLESAQKRHVITSGAQRYFEEMAAGLESRRADYLEYLDNERKQMAGEFLSRAGISADEFQGPDKPIIPESMKEIEELRKTRPEYYQQCMEVIKNMDAAQRTASQGAKTPYEDYLEAKQKLEDLDREHAQETAAREYPENLAAIEELAAMEGFSREVLRDVETRVNALLSSEGGMTLEALRQEGQTLEQMRQELSRLNAREHLSSRLTSRDRIGELDPEAAGLMKQTLEEFMRSAPDSPGADHIHTVDDLLEEEDRLTKAKLELEQLKDSESKSILRQGFSSRRGGFNFTELREMDAYEKQRRETELDSRISEYIEENDPPGDSAAAAYCSSVRARKSWETPMALYYDTVKTADEAQKRYERAQKNLGKLEATADQWRDVPEIAGSLEEYRRAKEERERLYVSSNPLPDTFTALGNETDPVRKRYTEEAIDQIFQTFPHDQPIRSLTEYYEMERALPSYMKNKDGRALSTKDIRNALKKPPEGTRVDVTKINQFIQAKQDIKSRIAADNRRKKPKSADMEGADRKLQEAEQALIEAETAYLKQLETEAADLRKTSDGIKDFIKKTVIPGRVKKKEEEVHALETSHREHKEQMDRAIKQYNSSDHSAFAARKQELSQEVKERTASHEAACARANNLLAKQRKKETPAKKATRTEGSRELWQAALEGRTRNLEEMIKAENAKSRRMSREADRTSDAIRTSIADYDNQATARTHQYRKQKQTEKKSACRSANMSRVLLGGVKKAMDSLNEGFFKMALTLSEAAIRAEAYDARKRQQEAAKKVQEIQEARMRKTTVAANQYEEAKTGPGEDARARQVSMDQLASRLKKLEETDVKAAEALKELYQRNTQLTEVQETMGDRIQENRDAIDGRFRDSSSPDVEQQAVDRLVNAISKEAAGGDSMRQELAKARERLSEEQLSALMAEDAKANDDMLERLRTIESASQNLAPLFGQQSLARIDTIVDISEKIINCLADRLDDAAGEKSEPINIREKMARLQESIQNKQETNTSFALEFVELAQVMYREGFQKIRERLDAAWQEKEEAFASAESGYLDFMEEEQQFNSFLTSAPREKLGTNRLDAWNAFYDQTQEAAVGMIDDQIQWAEKGKSIAGRQETEAAKAEADALRELEEHRQLRDEAMKTKADTREYKTKQAFYTTVLENGDQPQNPVTLTRSDIFAQGEEEFALLGKLTGVAITRDMDVDKAMDAFGSIYFNGLNAVAHFHMYERWDQVSLGDPKSQDTQTARKELFDDLARYEAQIRQVLKVPFDGTIRQELDEDTRALTSQMISVENSRLGLCPLELKPDVREEPPTEPEKPVYTEHEKGLFKGGRNRAIDEANRQLEETYNASMDNYRQSMNQYTETYRGIDHYNRLSHMMADDYNKMRVDAARAGLERHAARTELDGSTLQDTGRKLSFDKLKSDQNLEHAIQTSRRGIYGGRKENPVPARQQTAPGLKG